MVLPKKKEKEKEKIEREEKRRKREEISGWVFDLSYSYYTSSLEFDGDERDKDRAWDRMGGERDRKGQGKG